MATFFIELTPHCGWSYLCLSPLLRANNKQCSYFVPPTYRNSPYIRFCWENPIYGEYSSTRPITHTEGHQNTINLMAGKLSRFHQLLTFVVGTYTFSGTLLIQTN
jgi:hypothetical protein